MNVQKIRDVVAQMRSLAPNVDATAHQYAMNRWADTIDAALAEVGEPVAWLYRHDGGDWRATMTKGDCPKCETKPLYAHPPAQPPACVVPDDETLRDLARFSACSHGGDHDYTANAWSTEWLAHDWVIVAMKAAIHAAMLRGTK